MKGYTGHQESAAGAVGIVEAVQLVSRRAMPPALHLRHLNPHVYGAIGRNSVMIARGGPLGVPSTDVQAQPYIGISSFGAQGTNAHALLLGGSVGSCLETIDRPRDHWKLSRMWVAPRVSQTTDLAWVRRRTKNHSGSVTFESRVISSKNLEFMGNEIFGRPHLLPSTLLATLIGASSTIMSNVAIQKASITGSTFPAPLVLPKPRRRLSNAEIVVTTMIKPMLGITETTYQHQKVMSGKLAMISEQQNPSSSNRNHVYGVLIENLELSPTDNGLSVSFVSNGHRDLASAHEAPEIEASVTLTGSHLSTLQSPPTWVRSVECMVFNIVPKEKTSFVGAKLIEDDGWAIGSTCLISDYGVSSPIIRNLVVGEHDLPPTSPGPLSAHTPRAELNVEMEEENETLARDHPLVLMAEEERLMHIQAQV